jgi:hypothetical protein
MDFLAMGSGAQVEFLKCGSSGAVPCVEYGLDMEFAQEVMNAKTIRDFAAISFLPSPFGPDRRIVVLAGCGMQGTVAAAKMVTADGIREIARLRPPTTPFSVVIEIEIIDGQMTKPQIIDTVQWSIRA